MPTGAVKERLVIVREAFRSKLWPLPALAVVVALLLGLALPELDSKIDDDLSPEALRFIFGGGPEAARTVLGSVSAALVSLTSLTFSLTVVTLQLASGQFSPRLLRTFSSDRFVHLTLSLFIATFVFSLTVLRSVRTATADQDQVVPRLSVTLSFALAIASVLGLVLFLGHLAREIRVETMLVRVATEARLAADLAVGERHDQQVTIAPPPVPAGALPLLAAGSGFLCSVSTHGIVKAAAAAGAVVLLERAPNSSVVRGTPIGWVWAAEGGHLKQEGLTPLRQQLDAALSIGPEPTGAQDLSFGLAQLVDVMAKALSPGINDPRTAVHALGHAADLLCHLSGRDLGTQVGLDEQDQVRLFWVRPTLAELLDPVLSAVRRYGAGEPDVLARAYRLLDELAWSSDDPTHRKAVRDQLTRLDASIGDEDFDSVERARLAALARQVRTTAKGVGGDAAWVAAT